MNKMNPSIQATTIICVRKKGKVAIAGDGQVTLGETVIKHGAKKIRRLYNDKILAGFAGSSADSFALFSRFEAKLEQFHGNLSRAAVELAKDWRTDRSLRHLEAVMIVADDKSTFLISGTGDLIEPDDGLIGIGSGGAYARPYWAVMYSYHSQETLARLRRKRCRSRGKSASTPTRASPWKNCEPQIARISPI